MITVVFSDRHREQIKESEAFSYCADPARAGRIIDVLTPDSDLQKRLRRVIDSCNGGDDD